MRSEIAASASALRRLALLVVSRRARRPCRMHGTARFHQTGDGGRTTNMSTCSFRQDHRGDSVLMLVKNTTERGRPPQRWLFLHRDDRGRGLFLRDEPRRGFRPARGHAGERVRRQFRRRARAAALRDRSRGSSGAGALRYWANRELGDDSMLYTASPDGPGFQFSSPTIRTGSSSRTRSTTESCFYDRGTDVMLRFNTTIPRLTDNLQGATMSFTHFRIETDADGVALVTWDSPGRSMNVLNAEVIAEIGQCVDQIAADPAIKGAVITSGKERFLRRRRPLDAAGHGRPIRARSPRRRARRRR